MSDSPVIAELRKLTNSRLEWVASECVSRKGKAVKDGDGVSADVYAEILMHAETVLRERLAVRAVHSLASEHGRALRDARALIGQGQGF